MTEASPERANLRFIAAIIAVVAIGGFMLGYDSGVINGTVEGLETTFRSGRIGTGCNVASLLIGCAFGAFIAGLGLP
jgi:MFS transporter, SP family, sugar:H+ symporter